MADLNTALEALIRNSTDGTVDVKDLQKVLGEKERELYDKIPEVSATGIPSVFAPIESTKDGVAESELDADLVKDFADLMAGKTVRDGIVLTKPIRPSMHYRKELDRKERMSDVVWREEGRIYASFAWLDDEVVRPRFIAEVEVFLQPYLKYVYYRNGLPMDIYEPEPELTDDIATGFDD